ncbi:phage-related protein-like protein [Paenibacillus curdlanolyticus YK9]|uniref:Phage-related protein-like protein n=1 Tax=Paenibacillus curdlanolyticus YK9 TaxID=717606 RepID=E0IBU3_9BACL|nr:hypothetical protein [Paenibacillus curdlanolyticus]EFM10173.1 phage-related protein-like protein [Paenibacillus curdlanolyticus YK9]
MSAGSAGDIILDLGLNFGEFNRQLSGIAGIAGGLVSKAFMGLGGVIAGAFAVHGIVQFGREAINLASDLAEVQNVVNVTFGSMAADIDAFSKSALESYGLGELSAKRYASTMGAMLKSSGLAGESVKKLSLNMTTLSADMASFYNLSTDMAFDKIRSGIAGETEPLMQLGINMNVANLEAYALSQGITKSWQAMSQAEQVLLRYNYLLSVTGDAQGDFARNGQSWANQTRVLTEQWKIFQGTMGAGFINILTPVVKGLNWLIAKLQIAAQYFKAFTELIFGNAMGNSLSGLTASTEAAATGMGDVGTAAGGAGKKIRKAGKEVKGALAGFDQLNTLAISTADAMDDAGDSAGGVADMGIGGMDFGSMGPITPTIDTDTITSQVQGFINNVKSMIGGLASVFAPIGTTLYNAFVPVLTEAWGKIAPVLAQWKTQIGIVFADIISLGEPLKNWIMTGLIPFWQTSLEVLGTVVSGQLDSLLMVFTTFWVSVFPILQNFVTEGLPVMTSFMTGVIEIYGKLFETVKQIFDDIWSDAVDPAMKLVSKIITDTLNIIYDFWNTWGTKIVSGLKSSLDSVKSLWGSLWEKFLKPIVQGLLNELSWLWEKHLKGLITEVTNFVGKLLTAASDIYTKFVAPIIKYLIDNLGPTFANFVTAAGDVIGTFLGTVMDIAAGIIKALGGIVDFIAGTLTGDWKKAWGGIKTFMQGIADAIVGIMKGAVNQVIDAFNFMIRQLNTISIDMPDWVPGVGGESFGVSIPEIPKLAKGGLAYGPTLAMVGDNRGASVDPEVVSPLSKLQDMIGSNNAPVVDALQEVKRLLQIIAAKDPTFKVGETEFGRAAARAINSAQRQSQSPLLSL